MIGLEPRQSRSRLLLGTPGPGLALFLEIEINIRHAALDEIVLLLEVPGQLPGPVAISLGKGLPRLEVACTDRIEVPLVDVLDLLEILEMPFRFAAPDLLDHNL